MSKEIKTRWYVVHTYSAQEAKVKNELEISIKNHNMSDYFGRILIPTHEVTTISGQKKITREKKYFPSYLFVEMSITKETMNIVCETPGVTHFIGNEKPQPIRQSEVDHILINLTGEEKSNISSEVKPQIIVSPFKHGDAIKIKEGPFKDFDGVVEDVYPEKTKVKVLVSVFGRSTPVELDFYQVELIK